MEEKEKEEKENYQMTLERIRGEGHDRKRKGEAF